MAGSLFYLPRAFVIDGAGDPRSGAKLFFYQAGTLTAQDTYSDSALSTPNANPVVSDSAGVFGPIYLDNVAYRVILKDSADVTLYDQDDINVQSVGFGSTVSSKSGNYTVTTSDNGQFIEVDATATITLPAVADAGAGFTLSVSNTGIGVVTVDGNLAETVNNVASLILNPGEGAIIACDGDEWLGVQSWRFGSKVNSQAAPYTILTSDRGAVIVVTTAGTITLPTVASAGAGFSVMVVNVDSSDTTIDGNGAEEVNDAATITLGSKAGALLVCDGDEWFAIVTPPDASATVKGIVELATSAETYTGTDATRAVTPDGLHDMFFGLVITVNVAGTSTIDEASAGASGWTIADGNQTGEAVITHNLGLSDKDKLIVTATVDQGADPGSTDTSVYIEDKGVNSFQVQVQTSGAGVDGEVVNIICMRLP